MKIKSIILLTLLTVSTVKAENIEMYTENYPPYNMEENGKLKGLSIEILDAILKQMHSKQTINDVTLTGWSRGYYLAENKKNTMLFATARTKSREKMFKWVGPIFTSNLDIIAPKKRNIKIKSFQDLNRYKIGTISNDSGNTVLVENGVSQSAIQPVSGENALALNFKKLEKGRIDMFSYSSTVGKYFCKKTGIYFDNYEVVFVTSKTDSYFAFNKNTDDSVIEKWQKALNQIKANGIYQKILSKY